MRFPPMSDFAAMITAAGFAQVVEKPLLEGKLVDDIRAIVAA